jgi:hypothetical protein
VCETLTISVTEPVSKGSRAGGKRLTETITYHDVKRQRYEDNMLGGQAGTRDGNGCIMRRRS